MIYEYKEKKEKEIEKLILDQEEFKKDIEKNKEDFEKIIDEATNQIENFDQKTNQDSSIQ